MESESDIQDDTKLPSPFEMLESYKRLLDGISKNHSPGMLMSVGVKDAAATMSALFHDAKKKMLMIVDNSEPEVSESPEYLDGLKGALKKGVNAKVILLGDKAKKTEALKILYEYKQNNSGQVEIKKASKATETYLLNQFNTQGFDNSPLVAVMDDKNFRLKTDLGGFSGVGGFNMKSKSKELTGIFNEAYKTALDLR